MFKSIAAAAAILTCCMGNAIPAQANSNCENYDGVLMCAKAQGSFDQLVLSGQGYNIRMNVTCTDRDYILHSGWTGNITHSDAGYMAKAYCQGRGNMF